MLPQIPAPRGRPAKNTPFSTQYETGQTRSHCTEITQVGTTFFTARSSIARVSAAAPGSGGGSSSIYTKGAGGGGGGESMEGSLPLVIGARYTVTIGVNGVGGPGDPAGLTAGRDGAAGGGVTISGPNIGVITLRSGTPGLIDGTAGAGGGSARTSLLGYVTVAGAAGGAGGAGVVGTAGAGVDTQQGGPPGATGSSGGGGGATLYGPGSAGGSIMAPGGAHMLQNTGAGGGGSGGRSNSSPAVSYSGADGSGGFVRFWEEV